MSGTVQYVTLGIAKDTFAVPVDRVQEILDMCVIAALPHAPPHLLGMIDVRGKAVPVIDLRLKIGRPQAELTQDTRIIVLTVTIDNRELILGLKADRVFEVTELDSEVLDTPPEIGTRWRSDAIQGVGRRNGMFVTVLDLARLFSADDAPFVGTHQSDLFETGHAA